MRTTALLMTLAGAIGLAGCSLVIGPDVPQAADLSAARTPPATQGDNGDADVRSRIPRGPADPVYRQPAIPGGSPELAVLVAGPFRMRTWPVSTSRFAHGVTDHMPRWFEDPTDNAGDLAAPPFGSARNDRRVAVYGPGRFLVNLVALPVTAVGVHRLWHPAATDRTATIIQAAEGIQIVQPGLAPRETQH